MSLAISLNNALSGLRVNQRSLATISQNIANANNPEYSRKIVEQSSQSIQGEGMGVDIKNITRRIDVYLQDAIQRQTAGYGKTSAISDYADRLQILMGKPGASNSIDAYVTSFFNSMQSLADGPEQSSYRLSAVNSGIDLARRVSGLHDDIQDLRLQADQDIGTAVSEVNTRVRELYATNAAITQASTLGRPTSELLDQRDTLVRGISEYLDINTYTKTDGSVRLYTAGGATLIDENYSELDYSPATSRESLVNNIAFSALTLYRINPDGSRANTPATLITSGTSETAVSAITTGKIRAAIEVRDQKLPALLDQLDMFAARMRDTINAEHNKGSSYPGSTNFVSTREMAAGDFSTWTGKVRIGLLDQQGKPLTNQYTAEQGGRRPLTIDLSTLDTGTGNGEGNPSVNTIMKEINQYFGVPQNRVAVGNLSNIQLVSQSRTLPSSLFDFDFDLENISGASSTFFVSNASVKDDTGATLTPAPTQTTPSFALASSSTYETTVSSNVVTITAANAQTDLAVGDYVYLPEPSAAVNGIPAASLGGYFKILSRNNTGTSFTIEANSVATSSGTAAESGLTARTAYQTVDAGDQTRTHMNGTLRADFGSSLDSDYYDVTVNVGVIDDSTGTVSTASITYRINNQQTNLYNTRFAAKSSVGGDIRVPQGEATASARAVLVDANGKVISPTNGEYDPDVRGYLKIESLISGQFLSLDSADSVENGTIDNGTAIEGSGRGFSHFFELNNFFASNVPVATGDTVAGSASKLKVSDRISSNSGLISTGRWSQSNRPADLTKPPLYTYERYSGDNQISQAIGALANGLVAYDAAGGLSASSQTLNGYAAEILGFAGADATTSQANFDSAKSILEGFKERASALSGVNLDEELANTIIYQNAYAASARIITVADELFQTLLQSF